MSGSLQAVRWFPSEADLSSYVQSKSYEDEGGVKVAAAIVFNHVDAATAQWDYSVRVNFTQNFEMDQPGVGEPADHSHAQRTT